VARPDRHIGRFRSDAARQRFLGAYDAAVARWPAPPEQRDVPTRYGATHVLSSGSGRVTPIVLLPGIAVSAASWFAAVSAFGADRPVHAVDTIGDAGRSVQSAPVRGGDDFVRWLDDVLAALELERAHLVGLSYGGWLALNQASRSPDRLASMTAVDPIGAVGRADLAFLARIVPDSLLAAVAKSDPAVLRLLTRFNNGKLPEQPLLDLSVAGLRTFVAKLPFPKRMSDDDLRAIRVPAFVLFCARSPVNHAASAARRAQELIPGARCEIVPDAGHMLPVEQPETFATRVLEFVREADRA
jgi:pimeloyl-ACP methyl ester carboxylesterase